MIKLPMDLDNINGLSDSHFHILEMQRKGINIDDVFDKWIKEKGRYLIDIATDEFFFDTRVNFSNKYNFIYHSCGIHPNSCSGNLTDRIKKIEEQISHNRVVAIGETGLDYYWDTVDKSIQKSFFEEHIKLAVKHNLPLIIHNREASEDILSLLFKYKGQARGIIHCFSSDETFMESFINLGFYISFAGNLTYKNNKILHKAVEIIPENRVLIETDSPYLTPVPFRGKLNTPCYIGSTFKFLSEKINIDSEKLKNILNRNLEAILNIE